MHRGFNKNASSFLIGLENFHIMDDIFFNLKHQFKLNISWCSP